MANKTRLPFAFDPASCELTSDQTLRRRAETHAAAVEAVLRERARCEVARAIAPEPPRS